MKRPLATQRIAVVGAGIAGLACARRLQRAGAEVIVFEASPRVGGRLYTRLGAGGPTDLGAQYFTIDHPAFARAMAPLQTAGLIEPWRGRIMALWRGHGVDKSAGTTRWVGVPGMQSLAEQLARGLNIRYSSPVEALELRGMRWQLRSPDPALIPDAGFDSVALAVPAPRALALIEARSPMADRLALGAWEPVWAASLALPRRIDPGFDAAFVNDDPLITWIARDSSKPARPKCEAVAERWVVHASSRWSRAYETMPPAEVVHWLSHAFAARIGRAIRPRFAEAWCWSAARPGATLPERCLWDEVVGLGVAGDAFCGEDGGGARIESAYLSGLALAESMIFE